jgi:hypothetical protein
MNNILNEKQIKTIQNFWRWVDDNQTTIFNAYVVGINTQEEPVDGSNKWRVYKEYFYTLNISFTNDFDEL